jgi:hypothetical protein
VAVNERADLARWVSLQLVVVLVYGAVIAGLARWTVAAFGSDASYVSIWAVCVVAVGALRLQRLALPRRRRTRRAGLTQRADVEASVVRFLGPRTVSGGPSVGTVWAPPLPETLERRFSRMYRHVDRLTYAAAEVRHYDAGIRPVFAEIAADRLRRYFGIDMHTEPARARAVMGDDLWSATTASPSHVPTPVELDRWITALERLSTGEQPVASRPHPS